MPKFPVVLNFYLVNGHVVTDEKDFTGLMGRSPNIGGREAKYIAQIQISSGYENNVLQAAHDMVERILEWLPDESGVIKALSGSMAPGS